ncbi:MULTISPECIES: UDP-N-acetylmuramoyl-tripeptide--D-alanyl-D-alanine ligase [unclassified Halomonas]|uniref:UDP-N-acetylmuramoyl-tripeptide--D-alanyl-D- alanine ligase n=1 Tax=unclassified Halomonas TaxID=2609666 RepID=UPI0021E3E9E7|nr:MULTISPECIES: UDP-N-acetylmuramoyl-tripeptide--D-alanyl-D-alanine ligase [unclassified Halomonas]UYF98527.1 UDP-N-acetylmuramoyl-tripeptide--D-alanyl-D-alanine ligase [Halomonas sp. GD1P12]WNL40360.1 UDP-N-acetylmuramoyl-tripeptide--D-alanyl-D-alanine ligase [Halomonas sp. PAMB 3232]WNL43691.1 UDP-N-acetylmuramoyl-tripeptide--D-alanyl-D-alanine ligase [Halomonas sp. PAMB 3264]
MQWSSQRVAKALNVTLADDFPACSFSGVTTDTRQVIPGALFVALRGERFDGHDFLAQALEQGAAAALVETPIESALPQIVCADTRLALGLLGRAQRQQFAHPLVAVTGNSGKTTVKEMTAALLAPLGPVLATQGNLNNDFGAPLTLLRLAPEHRAAVVELGANHLGEIAWTSRLAAPEVAIITNVTGAHVGEFGGLGQIAQAKSEILLGLSPAGIAVLNAEDHYFLTWAALAPGPVVSYAVEAEADVCARALSCDSQGRYAFTLVQNGASLGEVQLKLAGKHNVSNALAAAAAALAVGVAPKRVVEALCAFAPLKGRLSVMGGPSGTTLLDDTYNANPGAMKVALETLMRFPGPHWFAMGAMGELGEESEALHIEVGRFARALGVDTLLTCGDAARAASDAFGRGHHFDDHETLARHLINTLPPNATLLVKGSRSAGMERVIAALLG